MLWAVSDTPNSAMGLASSTAGAIVLTASLPELLSLFWEDLVMSQIKTELSDLYLSKPAATQLVSMVFQQTVLHCRACRGTNSLPGKPNESYSVGPNVDSEILPFDKPTANNKSASDLG